MLKDLNWHSIRTIAFWAVVFILAGLNAVKGSIPADFTVLISILGVVEHLLAGNTTIELPQS